MTTRYQVFVSSTYEDLKAERSEVIQALLELDCFPAVMELFPAADSQAWQYIENVINESDYYVLIVGGKYGSIEQESGLSYTEIEYRHARKIGKPILSFVASDDALKNVDKIERDPIAAQKLKEFRDFVLTNRMCKFWNSSSDLGAKVSRGLVQLMRVQPAIGWVRKAELTSLGETEILQLKNRILELEIANAALRTLEKQNTYFSLQGEEMLTLDFQLLVWQEKIGRETPIKDLVPRGKFVMEVAWRKLAGAMAPLLVRETTPDAVGRSLCDEFFSDVVKLAGLPEISEDAQRKEFSLRLVGRGLERIRARLVAAGLVVVEIDRSSDIRSSPFRTGEISTMRRSVELWAPTPEGSRYFGALAVERLL